MFRVLLVLPVITLLYFIICCFPSFLCVAVVVMLQCGEMSDKFMKLLRDEDVTVSYHSVIVF